MEAAFKAPSFSNFKTMAMAKKKESMKTDQKIKVKNLNNKQVLEVSIEHALRLMQRQEKRSKKSWAIEAPYTYSNNEIHLRTDKGADKEA